jgi:hypothetical protein
MSFGFSVGDFVTVGTLAFELRRAYASAPEEYRSLSSDLDIFRGLVSQFERDVRIPMSPLNRCSPEQQLQLVLILGRANSILKELGIIRDNFQSFQSHPRVWDRLRFPSAKVRALQANLHLQTSTMKLFLASLTTTVVARIMTILEDQERLYQANWTTLLTVLAERGIAEEMAAPYRGQLEMHVQAIHEVAESERELSVQSNPHTNPFRSENSEGSVIYGDSDSSVDDGPNAYQNRNHGFTVGPPTAQHLVSRVCEGALCLQGGRAGGIRQRKNNWLAGGSGDYRYKLECPGCSFVGFQHNRISDLIRPTNTPLFFVPRQNAFTATSLEYHLDARANHRQETDGIFYRTIFFWKCHVRATRETRHREGEYECPFCPLQIGAGVFIVVKSCWSIFSPATYRISLRRSCSADSTFGLRTPRHSLKKNMEKREDETMICYFPGRSLVPRATAHD